MGFLRSLLILFLLTGCENTSGDKLPYTGGGGEGKLPVPDAFLTADGIDVRINNYLESTGLDNIYNDSRWKNIVAGIKNSVSLPESYILITKAEDLSKIASGNTYYIRGDIEVFKEINLPSNVNVYVEGRIFKKGNVIEIPDDVENSSDMIFNIKDKENVNLYGINNAKICSDLKSEGFHITNSKNVRIDGFFIADTWQGISCHANSRNVVIINNYIRKTKKRAVWMLATYNNTVVHNIMDSPGYDGIDFDAYTKNCVAFENFVIAAARWAGFVEEGAKTNYLISNICVMDDSQNKNKWQMGFADNGTTQGVYDRGGLTEDNYFIENVTFQPSTFDRSIGNGAYFAKAGASKGITYFWGNVAIGCGASSGLVNVEWLDQTPAEGKTKIEYYNNLYN